MDTKPVAYVVLSNLSLDETLVRKEGRKDGRKQFLLVSSFSLILFSLLFRKEEIICIILLLMPGSSSFFFVS